MTEANRFGSVEELVLGQEVWAWARGACRRARVVATGRGRAAVCFRLVGLNARPGALRVQWLPLERLRQARPSRAIDVPAPTIEQAHAAIPARRTP